MAHAFAIIPDKFIVFESEADEINQCREWGLLSEKAVKTKSYVYKRGGQSWPCRIVGQVDPVTAVIEFEDGQRHCIHPSYLKEMQASGFGGRVAADNAGEQDAGVSAEAISVAEQSVEEPPVEFDEPKFDESGVAAVPELVQEQPPSQPTPNKAASKGTKKQKLQLPEDKVKMTAIVKEFATVPNHFTEEEDEVIIYEAVAILDPEIEVGAAWSSHSNTLKKLELQIGDKLAFDGKIAAKKLTKHPVPYKINNPSKIQKE